MDGFKAGRDQRTAASIEKLADYQREKAARLGAEVRKTASAASSCWVACAPSRSPWRWSARSW